MHNDNGWKSRKLYLTIAWFLVMCFCLYAKVFKGADVPLTLIISITGGLTGIYVGSNVLLQYIASLFGVKSDKDK